jgi:hypothetical protein
MKFSVVFNSVCYSEHDFATERWRTSNETYKFGGMYLRRDITSRTCVQFVHFVKKIGKAIPVTGREDP